MNNFIRRIKETVDAINNAKGIIITEPRSGTHLLRGYALRQAAPYSYFFYKHTHSVPSLFHIFHNHASIAEIEKIKCVLLTRKDVLRRAISHLRCNQTGQHSSRDPAPKKDISEYNFESILHHLHRNWVATESTIMYLSHYRCPTLHVTYEEMCADLNGTVGKILDFVGIEQVNDVSLENSPIKKQANEITEVFVEQFNKDIGNISLEYLRDYAIKGETNA